MVWKNGDWKIIDDESGRTIYASEARQIWDGSIRHFSSSETRNPQEFVKARKDPKALTEISLTDTAQSPSNIVPTMIGQSSVRTRTGPATHLFAFGVLGGNDPGIGQMVINASAEASPFTVRYS